MSQYVYYVAVYQGAKPVAVHGPYQDAEQAFQVVAEQEAKGLECEVDWFRV